MTVAMRQEIERKIVTQIITDALAKGYTLGVNDGEEITLERCNDPETILKALFTTDDDWLLVYAADGKRIGWVRLIYGNDGYDVVNDHTTNLADIMTEADKLSDHYSN